MKILIFEKISEIFPKFSFFFRNYRKKQIFKFNYNYQFLKYSIHSSCWNLIQCSKNPFVTKDCECAHVRARFWCLKIVKNGKNHVFWVIFIYIGRIFWRAACAEVRARKNFLCHRVRVIIKMTFAPKMDKKSIKFAFIN